MGLRETAGVVVEARGVRAIEGLGAIRHGAGAGCRL